MGATAAEIMLKDGSMPSDFGGLVTSGNIDILSPLGKLVLKDGLQVGEEDEQEEICILSTISNISWILIILSRSLKFHQNSAITSIR
jgi:hypothetical protein